jgi:hypothetical protein
MKSLMIPVFLLFFITPSFAAEISEAEVKAFLDTWLSAQNTGSFTGYSDMYAGKFFGIKRSGERTLRFNREKWLQDRKRMFRNKMTVTAKNVQITTSNFSATIRFEQTWESRRFKDTGGKQLFLIRENNQLKIAREEMLDSKVLLGKGMVLDSTNFPFAFAMKEGIVIPDSDVKADLKKLKLYSSGVDYSVTAPIDTALLPASTRSLLGMQVRLYGPKGMCESKINGFLLVSKKIPHFGEIQRWKEEKTPRWKIAVNIYNEGLHHLVATTEKCSGDFAKDAKLPESPVIMGKKADRKTAVMARNAFKALPSYKSDIQPYIKDSYEESIRTFEVSYQGKTTTWVSMYVMSGTPFCGQEGGILAVLWKVDHDAEGRRRLKFAQYLSEDLEYATDIDNDGFIEFLSRDPETRGVPHSFEFVPTGGGKKQERKFKGSYDYDCPC